jgi:F-type H+-transporting ATPase subunit gamma
MPSLKELKNRINSVKSTQKITKAKKMVAASKLRRAQEAVEAARPYSERMERVLVSLASGMEGQPGAPRLLVGTGSDQTHLLIVATADRGLCGGFNSAIARAARDKARSLIAGGKSVRIICIGRKGRDALKGEFGDRIVDFFSLRDVKTVGFQNAQEVAKKVLEMFEAGEFDVCTLFFSQFKSVMSQVPTGKQLIPMIIPSGDNVASGPDLKGAIYEYEPDEAEILKVLLPRNVSVQIFRAMLENAAGEQGASMTAMDNATRNAGDMIDKLTLNYNRTRQAVITKELIEIISGAEAL